MCTMSNGTCAAKCVAASPRNSVKSVVMEVDRTSLRASNKGVWSSPMALSARESGGSGELSGKRAPHRVRCAIRGEVATNQSWSVVSSLQSQVDVVSANVRRSIKVLGWNSTEDLGNASTCACRTVLVHTFGRQCPGRRGAKDPTRGPPCLGPRCRPRVETRRIGRQKRGNRG